MAWEADGTPIDLLQLKHHLTKAGSLGDQSTDLWKTIEVWLDAPDSVDSHGPALTLVTTSNAAPGSAAYVLRADSRETPAAIAM